MFWLVMSCCYNYNECNVFFIIVFACILYRLIFDQNDAFLYRIINFHQLFKLIIMMCTKSLYIGTACKRRNFNENTFNVLVLVQKYVILWEISAC